ncbi:DUF4331 family protein [Streptomyces sp. NPDC088261]|uniref:DUF4331 family protein n=1 Tax=Streptomyces sp. NPDC088261 TaxID=3365851 RepID=UPI00382DD8C8
MKTTSARPCSRRTLEQSLVVLGTGALAAGPAVLSLAPGVSAASGHREAPMTSGDPWADKTSLYAFTSPARSDTVTLVANFTDLRVFDLLYGGERSERGQDTLAGYKDADPGQIFPAEEPRLGMIVAPAKKPQRLGVLAGDLAGFPNGRRPADDAIDISLQAVEGAAQTGKLVPAPAAGDKANTNDVGLGETLPYLALPSTTKSGGQNRAADADQAPTVLDLVDAVAIGGVGALLFGTGGFRLWRRRNTSAGWTSGRMSD